MSQLWKKQTSKNQDLEALVNKYTVGEDYILDQKLIKYDVQASIAHAKGLADIEIITQEELQMLTAGLSEIASLAEKDRFEINIEDEDCHSAIENWLVSEVGNVGKKIHTGRSRNDQVLAMTRLYMMEHLDTTKKQCEELATVFLDQAKKYAHIPMPGYSHAQQAMLSSVGHYLASFAESLADNAALLGLIKKQLSQNPLGSAAGFGVSLPLNRKLTTKELGFEQIQINSLYCQNSRGTFESLYLEGLSQVMLTLGRFAADMLLYTSREFAFFSTADELTTGSSIMPQKKNLDIFEIVRGNTSKVISNQMFVKQALHSLISGYNRDLQLIKKPLLESTDIALSSLEITHVFLLNMSPNVENISAAIKPDIYAADIANDMVVNEGIPFRDAYQKAMNTLAQSDSKLDPSKNIKSKISLGAPGNLCLDQINDKIGL